MATFEEAQRCPKCTLPGEARTPILVPDKPGYKVVTCTCRNKHCRWFNTGWAIQINPDGSVPEPRQRQPEDREPHNWPRVNPLLFNQRNAQMLIDAEKALRDTGGRHGNQQ
jgi:hypothetical protein